MPADRQTYIHTYIHTDTLFAILHTPTGGEVKTKNVLTNTNKMQVPPPGDLGQTLSYVRLVPPTSKLDKTYASSLIRAYSFHYMETWRHPQNRKYIKYITAVRGRASATCIEHSVKFRCAYWDMRVDRQTNCKTYRHANHNTSQVAKLPGAK